MRFLNAGRALVADQNISDEELGALLREFIIEADHGSWDSVPYRDLRAISRFMADLATYHRGAQLDRYRDQRSPTFMELADGRVYVEISDNCWRPRGDEGDTTRSVTEAELIKMGELARERAGKQL